MKHKIVNMYNINNEKNSNLFYMPFFNLNTNLFSLKYTYRFVLYIVNNFAYRYLCAFRDT